MLFPFIMTFTFADLWIFDNGQPIFSTDFVGNIPYFCPRTFRLFPLIELGFKGLLREHIRIIHDYVIMYVFMVNMSRKNVLVIIAEKFLTKFNSDTLCLFRIDFIRSETLNNMLC